MTRIPISVQHFSVKEAMQRNFEVTLKSLKSIGFDAIEFFGPFSKDAKELDLILKNCGLFCSGWHVETTELTEERINATIGYHQRIGNTLLIMPRVPEEMYRDYETIAGPTRDFFYSLTDKLNCNGIDIGIHPHFTDFKIIPGTDYSIWKAVQDNTPASFVMQFDTGSCMEAGCDPVTEILKITHPIKSIHLKPFSRITGTNATIGHDDIDLDAILSFVREKCGAKTVVIEYEGTGDELENANLCFKSLIENYSNYLN